MKKGQFIINIVLAAAVAGLFVLHFITGKDIPNSGTGTTNESSVSTGDRPIAYIQIDTLINNYDFFHELREKFQDKQKTSEAELASKSKKFENEFKDFQYKANKGLITRSTAQQIQQDLATEEQNLYRLREQLTMELAEEEQVMNRQIIEEITKYLKVFNKDKKYEYVFSYSFGSNILYADDALDITQEVIKGLNQDYKKQKGLEK